MKEQKPHVMTFEEVEQNCKHRLNTDGSYHPMILEFRENYGWLSERVSWVWSYGPEEKEEYNKTWRCWTGGFTEEQSKAVKWDDE